MKGDLKEIGQISVMENHGKGHGKSWNFKSSKEYEPCNATYLTLE